MRKRPFGSLLDTHEISHSNMKTKHSILTSLKRRHSSLMNSDNLFNNRTQLRRSCLSIYSKSSTKLNLEINKIALIPLKANSHNPDLFNRTQMKTTKNVILLIITFFIAWFPYTILTLSIQFVPNIDKQLHDCVFIIPPIFAKTSAVVNPIIYALRNSRFRVLIKQSFHNLKAKICCWR